MTLHTNKVVEFRKEEKQEKKQEKKVLPKVQEAMDAGDPQAVLDALSTKQRRFCEEYMKDFNASRAVIRAGYNTQNANRMGHQLLQNPGIRFAIDALILERADNIDVDANYVIKKIVRSLERAEKKENETAVLRASELLAKHLGMFIEKTEISGPEAGAIEFERKTEQDVAAFKSAISRLATGRRTSEVDDDDDAGSDLEA